MKHLALCLFAVFASSPVFAGDPDLSSPSAAVRSYLAATKANDAETAKKCWMVNETDGSGTLDLVIGMWIETRKLVAATDANFGADGLKLLGRWNRSTCTDRAIDRTLERIASAELREGRTAARLAVAWQAEDRATDPAFLCDFPFRLRRAGEQWKLDASVFSAGNATPGTSGDSRAISIGRDEMAIMKDLTAGLERGQFKDLGEFERELKTRVEALKAKYEKKE
jgi:hypothetical protein